jgi:hypothetical protein
VLIYWKKEEIVHKSIVIIFQEEWFIVFLGGTSNIHIINAHQEEFNDTIYLGEKQGMDGCIVFNSRKDRKVTLIGTAADCPVLCFSFIGG